MIRLYHVNKFLYSRHMMSGSLIIKIKIKLNSKPFILRTNTCFMKFYMAQFLFTCIFPKNVFYITFYLLLTHIFCNKYCTCLELFPNTRKIFRKICDIKSFISFMSRETIVSKFFNFDICVKWKIFDVWRDFAMVVPVLFLEDNEQICLDDHSLLISRRFGRCAGSFR